MQPLREEAPESRQEVGVPQVPPPPHRSPPYGSQGSGTLRAEAMVYGHGMFVPSHPTTGSVSTCHWLCLPNGSQTGFNPSWSK